MFTVSQASRTSSLVRAMLSKPLMRDAYLRATASTHPQRRGRPVTEPNSLPRVRSNSAAAPSSSVGNGPSPTRVVYAFEMPSTPWILVGGTPVPVDAPPAVGFEEVMKGYVP